ncbi:MAG: hypothetical protein ABFS14_02015 [Gemmatimonadota bacterium]
MNGGDSMYDSLVIDCDGSFQVEGHTYQIPEYFTPREVFAYRRLLEPIPDIPGGTSLSDDQRSHQRAYFFRRAAACVVPGLETRTLDSVPLPVLRTMHMWLADHRPELFLGSAVPA